MSSILNKIPIISTVLLIRDVFLLFWSWVSRNVVKAKIFALCSLTYASIRAAVGLVGFLYTRLNSILALGQSVGNQFSSSGSPTPGFFDKVNSVLPVAETIVFLSAYFAVCIATTAYMFVRSVYNAVPAKAT